MDEKTSPLSLLKDLASNHRQCRLSGCPASSTSHPIGCSPERRGAYLDIFIKRQHQHTAMRATGFEPASRLTGLLPTVGLCPESQRVGLSASAAYTIPPRSHRRLSGCPMDICLTRRPNTPRKFARSVNSISRRAIVLAHFTLMGAYPGLLIAVFPAVTRITGAGQLFKSAAPAYRSARRASHQPMPSVPAVIPFHRGARTSVTLANCGSAGLSPSLSCYSLENYSHAPCRQSMVGLHSGNPRLPTAKIRARTGNEWGTRLSTSQRCLLQLSA